MGGSRRKAGVFVGGSVNYLAKWYRLFFVLAYRICPVNKRFGGSVNIARRLAKPVYKRQRFLLSFLKGLNEPLAVTDFQELLFLYLTRNNLPYYEFVPYLDGSYSIQAGEDINTLEAMGWLAKTNGKISFAPDEKSVDTSSQFKKPWDLFSDELPKVRGNDLTKLIYKQFPYFAINSQAANSIIDAESKAQVNSVKEQFKNTRQTLFTIGYEGITVERYLNILITNNIYVLCDVRNNPISRKFGFSKSNLQKYLGNIGIEYVHIPELGIKSEKRNNLNSDEDYKNLFFEYEASLPGRLEYLVYLHRLLESRGRIALTCFEHDPSHCHRHVIRDFLTSNYNVEATDL